ncbi:oxysterol-binding protein 1 [Bactrocera neohumeralis]|uniref:oxysterol-binding protein 1 n=1 Tax=Bactrocera tryoni TaxID=59916 RepID=UPI001A95EAA2|nr:oxysterol-binding protein 1 [Bactrocera tryoni]XP_039948872.1 oxysterol-binding protein 1 [Bactrocera tryoni]XP_050338531.1 oxysterol-binding protein 1 [Bactrocera neohumeralis]
MSDMLLNKPTPERSVAGSKDPEMKGWLMKWTNYIKGYQRRWFVLSRGVLSYYRSQAEMNHTCRGTISLHGALIHTVDSCTFVISNGGTQTFHIKAANEVERQSWVTALELAKAKAIRTMETEEEEEVETSHVVPSQEINTVMAELTGRLESLRTCYDLITKHGIALQRALSELESNDEESLASRTKIVNERATLFRITCNAMINACNDYLRSAESQGHKWSKMVEHEREQRQRLEEMVEMLAKQQTRLEQAAHTAAQHNKPLAIANESAASPNAVTSDDENEFFDAEENNGVFGENSPNEASGFVMTLPSKSSTHKGEDVEDGSFVMKLQKTRSNSEEQTHHSSSSENEELKLTESEPQQVVVISKKSSIISQKSISKHNNGNQQNQKVAQLPKTNRQRRTRVPDKPNHPLNLWSVMKNCIGKELSKIPMPVNFNEPLSMLQRLTEDYEYADLLDAAARCTDECEQLAYVAAFTITSYATTTNRTGKPFNPLLGETFECDRMDDLGWRVLAEQVSHHPPMAALHCEGREWTCWQEFTMTSKFRGKYLQVIPLGSAYVNFPATGHKYTWRKVTTTINNIIVGKLWVDQHGDMEIRGLNAASGLTCHLKYIAYSYFSREQQRRVKGVIMDRNKEVKWVLRGTWDASIEIAPVLSTSGSTDSPVYQTGGYKTVWTRRMQAPDSDKFYNFTTLAAQLNEPEEGVAPTDSRLRPDQRLMEDGKWDESNREKLRLEEKQRRKRRERESEAEAAANEGRPYQPYEPLWFRREKEEGSDNLVHVFNESYWKHKQDQDWSQCPDIF